MYCKLDPRIFYLYSNFTIRPYNLQILDFHIIIDEGPTKNKYPKIKRNFSIGFELYCKKCKLHDLVKISNTGSKKGNSRIV
jgi:hypothetical protein